MPLQNAFKMSYNNNLRTASVLIAGTEICMHLLQLFGMPAQHAWGMWSPQLEAKIMLMYVQSVFSLIYALEFVCH